MNAENPQGTIVSILMDRAGQGRPRGLQSHRLLAKARPLQEGACPPDEDCGEHEQASATVPLFNADDFQAVHVDGSKVVLALFSNRYVCVNILTNARFPVCFSEVEGWWRGKTDHNR